MTGSPIFGDEACALCKNHKTPDDLNFHVTDTKTCADVHLELSLIDSVNNKDKCVSEQGQYRSLCCQSKKKPADSVPTDLGVGAAAVAGALLLWFVSKKVLSVKVGVDESLPSDYKSMKDAPISKSRSKSKQKSKASKSKKDTSKAQDADDKKTDETEEEDGSILAMWNGNNS